MDYSQQPEPNHEAAEYVAKVISHSAAYTKLAEYGLAPLLWQSTIIVTETQFGRDLSPDNRTRAIGAMWNGGIETVLCLLLKGRDQLRAQCGVGKKVEDTIFKCLQQYLILVHINENGLAELIEKAKG